MVFKDRKMGVPGVLCFLPPESHEKKTGHHQPTRGGRLQDPAAVCLILPCIFFFVESASAAGML